MYNLICSGVKTNVVPETCTYRQYLSKCTQLLSTTDGQEWKQQMRINLQMRIIQNLEGLFCDCCSSFSKILWWKLWCFCDEIVGIIFRIVVESLTLTCIFKPSDLDSFLQLTGMQQPVSPPCVSDNFSACFFSRRFSLCLTSLLHVLQNSFPALVKKIWILVFTALCCYCSR